MKWWWFDDDIVFFCERTEKLQKHTTFSFHLVVHDLLTPPVVLDMWSIVCAVVTVYRFSRVHWCLLAVSTTAFLVHYCHQLDGIVKYWSGRGKALLWVIIENICCLTVFIFIQICRMYLKRDWDWNLDANMFYILHKCLSVASCLCWTHWRCLSNANQIALLKTLWCDGVWLQIRRSCVQIMSVSNLFRCSARSGSKNSSYYKYFK